MPDVTQYHLCKRVHTPWGWSADIDVGMVHLVKAIWALGLYTNGACENLGESIAFGPAGENSPRRLRLARYYRGYAWLKMPADAGTDLLAVLAKSPKFRERMNRWTMSDAWESYVYLQTDNTGGVAPSEWAQIHFPADQIDEVTSFLITGDQSWEHP